MNVLKRVILIALVISITAVCGACRQSVPPASQPPAASVPEAPTDPTENTEPTATVPVTEPEPESVSILDFLRIAVQPVGQTMYVWGGGWNEADTGAGAEAVTLGVSPRWAEFAAKQDSSYSYENTKYQIHDGLDCSGYVGWAVYNTLETENGQAGYVYQSTKMSKQLADRGLGTFIAADEVQQWLPGDIMSMKGHVWIVVGMCEDGSVLLLHASPPGVIFSGTLLPDGSNSQASELARQIMREHYPGWYARYPRCARSHAFLTASSAMRWSADVLSDEEGLRHMTAQEVVQVILETNDDSKPRPNPDVVFSASLSLCHSSQFPRAVFGCFAQKNKCPSAILSNFTF